MLAMLCEVGTGIFANDDIAFRVPRLPDRQGVQRTLTGIHKLSIKI
jgi:hypothetical protein